MPHNLALDMNVIDNLRDLPAGGDRLISRLVDVYLTDTPGTLRELRRAVSEEDVEAARFAAHSLKSSSANIGARRLMGLAASIERGAREGSLSGSEVWLREIEQAYSEVRRELRCL